MFKLKSNFNPRTVIELYLCSLEEKLMKVQVIGQLQRRVYAVIELYLCCLEEKLMKVEVSMDKFNSQTNSEGNDLYDLKNVKSTVIRSTDKGLAVVVWHREDYIKKAQKQLEDEEVNEKVFNNAASFLKTINKVMAKTRKRGDLKKDNLDYFSMKDSKFSFMLLIVVTILKKLPHFRTIICNYYLKR